MELFVKFARVVPCAICRRAGGTAGTEPSKGRVKVDLISTTRGLAGSTTEGISSVGVLTLVAEAALPSRVLLKRSGTVTGESARDLLSNGRRSAKAGESIVALRLGPSRSLGVARHAGYR